ncbi:fungal cellulose binding domain-containing protein [Ilyonectria destructans]|nr:fungal cellulose binding domain-containing protein [Ilyonectria destructans]
MKLTTVAIASLVHSALAQSPLYGQCGGKTWTGATTCVSGTVCQFYNDYYSQCIPGTGSVSSSTTLRSITTTSATKTATATSKPPVGTGFPTTSGTLFTIDGVTKYFAGSNCYWCSFLPLKSDAELVMSHLEEAGLKILRVWGFNDVNTKPGDSTVWFQYLSSSGSEINTGANGLQRLDWIVEAAENHGIKLIINFVNNWDDYGGMKAYTNAFGGDHAGWYTNTQAQAQYRKYIEAVISRYSDSSALFAWELANEPRCQGCDTGVIHEWATEISQYIKALDPNHLVTLGDEGFGLPGDGSYPYTYYEGVDWEKALTIDTLDFATFHLYPTSWSVSTDWGNGWIKAHAALCAKAGIPCFFEEYGMTYDQCAIESGWQDTSLAADGMAGDAFWQLGDTISTGQSHNDGNTIYYGSDVWTCLVTNHVADIPS